MTIYAGMDVSDKTTHICVVDGEGVVDRAVQPRYRARIISFLICSHSSAIEAVAPCERLALSHCGFSAMASSCPNEAPAVGA